MSAGETVTPYAPRRISGLTPETVRGWMVKRYGISATRAQPPDIVLEAGRIAVERSLPAAYPEALPCAVSIAHEDLEGCYLVVTWWSPNRLLLSSRTWLSSWDAPTDLGEAPERITACVWELVAIDHERDAWMRHVLQPEVPDLAAYRDSTVTGMF